MVEIEGKTRVAKIRVGLKVLSENERGEYWTIPGKVKRPLAETGNSNLLGRKPGKGAKSCQCLKVHSHADWTQKNFSNISSLNIICAATNVTIITR